MARPVHFTAIAIFVLVCSGLFAALGLVELAKPHATASRASLVAVTAAGVLGMATGAGILRRWWWARISIIVFAALIASTGIALAPFVLFMRGQIPPEATETGRVLSSGFCLILVAVGLWLAYLFSASSTKKEFGVPFSVDPMPFGIALIAWSLIIGAGIGAVGLIRGQNPAAAMTFGFLLTGWRAISSKAIFAAVDLYLGGALLRRGKQSIRLATYLTAFSLLDIAVFFLRPGRDARLAAFYDVQIKWSPALITRFSSESWSHFFELATAASAVLAVLFLWLLRMHRNAFAVGSGSDAGAGD